MAPTLAPATAKEHLCTAPEARTGIESDEEDAPLTNGALRTATTGMKPDVERVGSAYILQNYSNVGGKTKAHQARSVIVRSVKLLVHEHKGLSSKGDDASLSSSA